MPIHLPALSRRGFLASTVSTVALGAVAKRGSAAAPTESASWILFSDTHVAEDRQAQRGEASMAEHLTQACRESLEHVPQAAGVLINGDCAHLEGLRGDYGTLVELLEPLRAAGKPVHLGLGNHDHRQNFWEVLERRGESALSSAERHATVIETAVANLFLLDSLRRTNETPGELGEAQRCWLAEELDRHADRPAIVFTHHQPLAEDAKTEGTGLADTGALFEVLAPRRQVKALLFGHTHHWQVRERDGIHLVNLPAVAYPFAPRDPVGWVRLDLMAGGATLELRCLDPAHPKHLERHELTWRA